VQTSVFERNVKYGWGPDESDKVVLVPRFSIVFGFSTLLMICGLSSAQDKPTVAPDAPPFLKLCSHKNPRPCIDKPPVVIHSPDAEYSMEAHNAKIEGSVVLETVVGTDGLAYDIHVSGPLGHGLDELAVEALKKWTFKPAKSAGKPVPAKVSIEMRFRYH
jgi:TonB family protein